MKKKAGRKQQDLRSGGGNAKMGRGGRGARGTVVNTGRKEKNTGRDCKKKNVPLKISAKQEKY